MKTASPRSMARRKVTLKCDPDKGRTKQTFADESNINRIVKKYAETGIITNIREEPQKFGYASAQSFSEAQYIVAEAKSDFAQLPSQVRAHFNHDPAEYLDAAGDPTRRPEFVELGLLDPPIKQKAEEAVSEPQANTERSVTEEAPATETDP